MERRYGDWTSGRCGRSSAGLAVIADLSADRSCHLLVMPDKGVLAEGAQVSP
jgi:hypothetical protein